MAVSGSPNVIVFLADDLAYGDVGCHGNPTVGTPHIDRFAAESAELDRFYVSPVCSPTRASLLTGRWNFRTGVSDVFGAGCEMSPRETTLAEDLRAVGYVTGLFGKWHLGDKGPHRPTQRGFDETLTFEGPAMFADQYFDPILLHNDRPEKWPGYCMDVFTDAAIDFIRRHRRERFFLYLPANLIHTPMVAPESLVARYDNLGLLDSTKTIYGMVAALDQNFGRLRSALAHLGLEDDTLLFVLSDNGPCSGSEPVDRHMAGLHGLKGTPYENGIRVPSFVRWPNGFAGGRHVGHIAAHIDVRPTVLEATGAAQVDDGTMDGRSLLSLLRERSAGSEWADRRLFLQWDSGRSPRHGRSYCVVEDRWKLVQPTGMDAPEQQHNRDRYGQLCRLQGRGERSVEGPPRYELYDLRADPGERDDVADTHPEVVKRLRDSYDEWFADVTMK